MKKTKFLAGATVAAFLITSSSFSTVLAQGKLGGAEKDRGNTEMAQKVISTKGANLTINSEKVTLKKDNTIKEVDRRVTSLKNLLQKIGNLKKISDSQKTTLTAQIEIEIDKLSKLKAEIIATTDKVVLAELKKSIIDSYRIYALFLPKITIIAHGDQVIQTAELMKLKAGTVEAQGYVDGAKTKAQTAISSIVDLLPSDYPACKSTLDSARTLLNSAIKDLNLARPMLTKNNK